jgi:hypothetical protein
MKLRKCFFYWDPAHRVMLAEGDVRGAKIGDTQKDQFPFLSKLMNTIKGFLADVRYGKKYEHLLQVSEKYVDEKFYKLNFISTTRFAAYIHRVFSAFLKDVKFIIESLRDRCENNDNDAKSLLQRISNVKFLAFLAGITDVYNLIAKLCGYVQNVNLFIWQRFDMIRKSMSSLKEMAAEIRSKSMTMENWPTAHTYWPLLKNGTLIKDLSGNEDHRNYYLRCGDIGNDENSDDLFLKIRGELLDILVTFETAIDRRLLNNAEDRDLSMHTERLTNVLQYKPLAQGIGPELFSLRVLEKKNLIESCRFVTDIDISDAVLKQELHVFLKRLHEYLAKENDPQIVSSRDILYNFLVKPELYANIANVMHCLVTCYFLGHNESYVESIGSKLKAHNPPDRNLSLLHLDEEITIAWNGPYIQQLKRQLVSCMVLESGIS